MLTALGFVFGVAKCAFTPEQLCNFLGLLCESALGRFTVPEGKLQRFEQQLQQLQVRWDAGEARSACGVLVSFAPALQLGPLLTRALREAGAQAVQPLGRDFFSFWQSNVLALNGRPWALQLVTDTSESAYGAHVRGTDWAMAQDFTAAEQQHMQAGRWSSTAREIVGANRALWELLRAHRDWLPAGAALQIVGDNQGACAASAAMRGNPSVFAAVADLRMTAWTAGLHLQFVWQPRTQVDMRLADELSKQQDPTDWRLSRTIMRQQVYDLLEWYPQFDLFASQRARQVLGPAQVAQPAQAARPGLAAQPERRAQWDYYLLVWDGNCSGVDALSQAWAPQRADTAQFTRYFAFPPPSLLLSALHKIVAEGPEVLIVCVRALSSAEEQALRALPCCWAANLRAPSNELVKATRVVPQGVAEGGWKTPLQAILVRAAARPAFQSRAGHQGYTGGRV